MFVRQSKYDTLLRQYIHETAKAEAAVSAYNGLLKKWNELIDKINDKGGVAFMASSLRENVRDDAGLTPEDITRLLMLCHPDKHGGKPMAQDMTAKLLGLREKIRP